MQRNPGDKTTIGILNKKISHLRSAVYIFLAISILMSCLTLFWIYNSYSEPSVETYYASAPETPKAFLYLSPQEGRYRVGDEFSIEIFVNTAGSNINAIAAYLSYNKNKMEVTSIDTSGSILDIPIEQTMNKVDGKIKIGLAKPTPGVKAYNGKVATVHFKTLAKVMPYTENIYFDFTKGSDLFSGVYLNDKKGTNILDAVRGAKILID